MQKLLIILALAFFTVDTPKACAQALDSTALQQESAQPPFDAAQVFEWWDDGLITAEQADEIFSRLEEDNYDEACLLAEVYAQEPCQIKKEKRPHNKRKHKKENVPRATKATHASTIASIVPHGRASWKGQYDSEGHLKKHRKELQLQFYYFKLRLGSQELISYRRDNFESYFGQISTLELHSHLPLDTLWGAALLFPIGKFRLGTFIDTAKTFQTRLSFLASRSTEISGSFWKFSNATAIALQAHTTLGQISAWYQFGQNRPLVKIQLQNDEKWLTWKTTAYIHGDTVPQGLNLSKGIAENWLWASQTFSAKWPEALNMVLSAKARLLSPVGTDSVSARFKLSLESGPAHLRPSINVICIEAAENCQNTEWKGSIQSAWDIFAFNASAKFRYNRKQSSKLPKIELAASYRTHLALAKLTVAFPETTPARGISVQNEVSLHTAPLGCDFVFAFKKTQTKPFKPNFAHIQASLNF